MVLCYGPGLFSQEMKPDTISIEKTECEPGEDIRIDYRCSEANLPYLWIGVFKADLDDQMMKDAGLSIKILGELNASVLLNAPDIPGNYQVRLFSMRSGNVSVFHRLNIEVKVLNTGENKLENYPGYQEGMVFALSDDKRFDIVGIHEEGSVVAIKYNKQKTWPHILAFKMNETAPEFIVELGKNGYPLVARFFDHTIFYYNYTSTTCDISVISPDSQIRSLKGVTIAELAELQKLRTIYNTSPAPQATSQNGNTIAEFVDTPPLMSLYNENRNGPCAGQDYFKQEEPTILEKIGLRNPTTGEFMGLSGNMYSAASCILRAAIFGPGVVLTLAPCASTAISVMQKVLPHKYKKTHMALQGLSMLADFIASKGDPVAPIFTAISRADILFGAIGNAIDAHQEIKKSGGYITYMKKVFGNDAQRHYNNFSYSNQLPEFPPEPDDYISEGEPLKKQFKTSNSNASKGDINQEDYKGLIELAKEGMAKIAKVKGNKREEIDKIAAEYEAKMKAIAQKRECQIPFKKTDKENHYSIKKVTVYDARWRKHKASPEVMLEIEFKAKTKKLKTKYHGTKDLLMRTMLFTFYDKNGGKVTGYGLSLNKEMIGKDKVTTSYNILYFEKTAIIDFDRSWFRAKYQYELMKEKEEKRDKPGG
jgi:hypothetical protein